MRCHMLSFAAATLTDLDGLRRHLAVVQSTMTRCLRCYVGLRSAGDLEADGLSCETLGHSAGGTGNTGEPLPGPEVTTHKYTSFYFAVSESKFLFSEQQCFKCNSEELQIITVYLAHCI